MRQELQKAVQAAESMLQLQMKVRFSETTPAGYGVLRQAQEHTVYGNDPGEDGAKLVIVIVPKGFKTVTPQAKQELAERESALARFTMFLSLVELHMGEISRDERQEILDDIGARFPELNVLQDVVDDFLRYDS